MNNGFWKRVFQGLAVLAVGALCTAAWSHEHRITQNETRYESIEKALERIESVLVDIGRKRR